MSLGVGIITFCIVIATIINIYVYMNKNDYENEEIDMFTVSIVVLYVIAFIASLVM